MNLSAHLEPRRADPTANCLVCGASDLKSLYQVTDTNQDVPGEWQILACPVCSTGVLSPFPDAVTIGSFYQNLFYTEEGQRFNSWIETLRGQLARLRGRTLNRLLPSKGRLLDFGSGVGHFSTAQTRNGWQVQAVDPYNVSSLASKYCCLTEDGFELHYSDDYFDAITLWYVIEHLRDPAQALRELRRVLKPSGILVLAQQDFASLQARIFGPHWLFLDPPRHLWQFTAASMALLAEQHGLIVVEKSWASLEMGPFCMLQSLLNRIVGNHNDLFRFLKDPKLPILTDNPDNIRFWPTVASLVLLPWLGPLVLVGYFVLLLFHSSDVVTLYLRKV